MKYILKRPEPAVFTEWKAGDKMAHKPSWRRVPSDIKQDVHSSLMEEQGYLCCYCETRVHREGSHVEHFRPKGRRKYRDRQLDYINLLCSCGRDSDAGEPKQCGARKGSWFDEELLVSPLDPTCEGRFSFTGDGRIHAAPDDRPALETIKRLALDSPKLDGRRQEVLHSFVDLEPADVKLLLEERDPDGRFVLFYTAVKDVLLP